MSNSDGRVLKFFVSGALLTGAAGCTKETEAGHPEAPRASEAAHAVEQEPSAAPKTPVAATLSGDAGAPGERPAEIGPPKRVNTNYQQEPRLPRPIPSAVAPPEPKRVNPSHQDEPQPPRPAQPTAPLREPDRVNTNYQQEIPARPRAPAKLQEESTNTGPQKNKEKDSPNKEN